MIVASRNKQRGQQAVDKIVEAAPEATVELMLLDLASLASVKDFVTVFTRRFDRLDLLVNNAGWGIFRPVTPKQELLDLPSWPFAELAESWGGVGIRATTSAELKTALRDAHRAKGFVIIDCIVPKNDASPMSRRYIRQSARKGSN